jgi:hypothetical protein
VEIKHRDFEHLVVICSNFRNGAQDLNSYIIILPATTNTSGKAGAGISINTQVMGICADPNIISWRMSADIH